MKKTILFILSVCLLISCRQQDELVALSPEVLIDRLVSPYTDFGFLSGVSVGILKDEKVQIFHFGKSGPEAGIAPTDSTIYALGGLSQVFTGILASDLIQEGRIQLNDTLDEFLPVNLPVVGEEPITIVDLGTHTSGLVAEAFVDYDQLSQADQALIYRDFETENLYAFLTETRLLLPAGQFYIYSRIGIATLGQAIENEVGFSLDEFFQERVAKPINMANTLTLPNFSQGQFDRLAPAFDSDQQKLTHFRYGALVGSSGFYSTIEDMTMFIEAQMDPLHPISDALEFSHTSQFDLGAGNAATMGWLKEEQAGGTVIYQSGASAHAAYIGFNPSQKIGVVVLTNTNSESSVRTIGREIMNILWL